MKIYVVTSGCYSDYGINGVFSTAEKAEAYRKLVGGDANDVEVYEVDELAGHVRKDAFMARIHLLTGEITHNTDVHQVIVEPNERAEPFRLPDPHNGFIMNTVGRTSYVGPEHVEKLCAEARQAALVKYGGVDNLEWRDKWWLKLKQTV